MQSLIILWGIANVLWALWPKPKSERAQRIWMLLHHVMQLVVTTSRASGTLTWPFLLRAVGTQLFQGPDPFTEPVLHAAPLQHVTIKHVSDGDSPDSGEGKA